MRVLAENRFPPQFNRSAYRGFVSESTSPASLVMTYGNKLLILEATDQDFTDVRDSTRSQHYKITYNSYNHTAVTSQCQHPVSTSQRPWFDIHCMKYVFMFLFKTKKLSLFYVCGLKGFNPRLQYSLNSQHNSSRFFYITQEGLLIAKTNQLHSSHKYFLEVWHVEYIYMQNINNILLLLVLENDN